MQSREERAQTQDEELDQTDSSTRSSQQLPSSDTDWRVTTEPVNPGWRSDRSRVTRRRRPERPLASAAELGAWLQQGGWRWAAMAAGGILVLVALLRLLGGPSEPLVAEQSREQALSAQALPIQPTVTVPAEPPPPLAPQIFVVTGTAAEGLLLRPEAGTAKPPLKSLPEGTRLEFMGEEVQGSDYVWIKVRDPEGTEGWVARDFVQPAP